MTDDRTPRSRQGREDAAAADRAAAKSDYNPRKCSCHPDDVYFPCTGHHAFWICENYYLKSQLEALKAALEKIVEIVPANILESDAAMLLRAEAIARSALSHKSSS